MAACMEIRKTCGAAMAALACILAVATAAAAAAVPARIDWRSAHEFARGMRHVHLSLTVPRRMEADLVRVDMRTPGLRVAGSGRSPEWGKPMPDFRKSGIPIDVRRVKTGDFLAAHRRDGTNMVLAVNTSPWRPWTKPFTHKYGNMHNLTVSGGQVVSHCRKRTGMIVVSDDNKARVADALDDMEIPRTSIAHPGLLGTIMRDGAPTRPCGHPEGGRRRGCCEHGRRRLVHARPVERRGEAGGNAEPPRCGAQQVPSRRRQHGILLRQTRRPAFRAVRAEGCRLRPQESPGDPWGFAYSPNFTLKNWLGGLPGGVTSMTVLTALFFSFTVTPLVSGVAASSPSTVGAA